MDNTSGRYQITEGTDVYGSDGEKVGSIVAVRPNYVVVEKGFFFPTDYYIPVSAVSGVQDGGVYLNVTKDAALNQGWDAIPADYEGTTVTTGTTYETGTVYEDAGTIDTTTVGTAATGVAAGTAGAFETDTVRTRDVNVTGDVIEGQGPGGRTEGGSASY